MGDLILENHGYCCCEISKVGHGEDETKKRGVAVPSSERSHLLHREVRMEEQTTKKRAGPPGRSVDIYAAQCEKCLKWRKIDTQEEYEEIRSRIQEEPFVCEKKEGMFCRDAGDLHYDSSRTWVIDKPGLPRTPKGFKRSLVLRKDYSKMDAYYITPTGKKLRTRNEIAAFIDANQDYKNAPLGDFNFTVPKVMEDTVPCGISERSPKPSKLQSGVSESPSLL